MVHVADMTQEEYLEYERKREIRREKVVAKLDESISEDTRQLEEKQAALGEEMIGSFPDSKNIKELQSQIKELENRVEANREIRKIVANPDKNEYRHGDRFDNVLDRDFDSHGGAFEGSRVEALPAGGVGFTLLLELREIYYKWKGEKEKDE